MKKVMCAKCGGSMKKYAKGGSTMKTTVGKATPKGQIYGIPQTGPTGPNYQGVDTMKKGGTVKKVKKMAKGGATSFGMLSVKAGIDNNPKPTAADRIAGAKMNKKKIGGSVKKYQNGGSTVTSPQKRKMTVNTIPIKPSKYTTPSRKVLVAQKGGSIKPKPKYVYGDAPGIGGPAAGQAATPGEALYMDQKLAAQKKAKAAAAKKKN